MDADNQKQDAVNELMKNLAQITTDLIDNVKASFAECLRTLHLDPAKHAEYINTETEKVLSDISNRATSQHRVSQIIRKYQLDDKD